MKKNLLLWIVFITCSALYAQNNVNVVERNIVTNKQKENHTVPLDSIKNMYGARYVDYKIITAAYDTIQIDTTLTITKFFKHNYTQKDDFEWVRFANQGQTFNQLGYQFINHSITPDIGIGGKLFNYYSAEDFNYYHVPTPTTILFYQSGFDGQVLHSTFTTNFGKFQNFQIGYKGLRSLGEYQNARASHVNFRIGYTYFNPKKRYQFRWHISTQQIDNQENGGLTGGSIAAFKSDDPDFSARGRVDVNLYNSESFYKTNRYYLEHELRILNSKDSLEQNLTNLKLGHTIVIENKKYEFQSTDVDFFESNPNLYGNRTIEDTNDKTEFNTVRNNVHLKFNSPWILGNFKIFGSIYNTKQVYDSIRNINSNSISKQNHTNYTSVGATWNSKYKGVFLNAYGEQVVSGGNLGSNLHIIAGFQLKDATQVKAGFQLKSASPNANTTLYQSNFENLNWNNIRSFKNEIYTTLYGSFKTAWIQAEVHLHKINNYTYFNTNSVAAQHQGDINYLKVKLSNQLRFKKFYLNHTVLYQKITQGNNFLRVPELVTRNALYYQNYFFKGKPLLAQIGISFKYFSKFFANEFNPVLNEFYLQNHTKIGGYPTLDVFVNGEVRRTRIYFLVQNITDNFTGRNYFATPTQPLNDLKIRLGVVWNFWN